MLQVVWNISFVYIVQLLGSIKFHYFLKIEQANKSIFPIEIRAFFLGKLGGPFFSHYSLNVTGSL